MMRSRRLARVGAALLGAALVLGTLSMVLAPSQLPWGSGSWGAGGMLGSSGPMMGGLVSMGPMMGPHGMPGGSGASAVAVGGPASGLTMVLGWLATLAFLAAVIVGVVLLVRWLSITEGASGAVAGDSALEILKRRYIAGEIDETEYEEGVTRVLT